MPNNYLSVLYKHIIQVENKNVGLKVCVCGGGGGGWGVGGGGHKHTIATQSKKWGHVPPIPSPPPPSIASYASVLSSETYGNAKVQEVWDHCLTNSIS